MNVSINAEQLCARLPDIVKRVRKGARFTVIYRSQPAFQIVPVTDETQPPVPLADDSLYRAPAVGRSRDGVRAADHGRHFRQMAFQAVPAGRARGQPGK